MARVFERSFQSMVSRIRWSRVSKLERNRIGMHMWAVYCGKRTQVLYRQRGITDPCAKARAVHMENARKRREAKALAGTPRSKVLPIA